MAVPQESYMKLTGGTNSSNSTIYTSNNIKVGDTIKISGTASNNGVFSVSQIMTDTSGGNEDVYYVLKGNPITTEGSPGTTDPIIETVRTTGDKLCALGDVDSAGNVDIWSSNATSDYTAKDNGWTSAAIQPTIDGNDAKYIYHFVDEALRVCNVNEENTSLVKWFGYIQRHQFSLPTGLVFAEWQEHPNTLNPPMNNGTFTICYGTASHANGTATNFYQNNRGVVRKKIDSVSDLRIQDAHNDSTTSFSFENTSSNDRLDQSLVGEVISIGSETNGSDGMGIYPKEFLLCTKQSSGSAITYSRAYGGKLLGSAPHSYDDTDNPILERGMGFNIAVTDGSANGDWEAVTYEFYQTFVYDNNQESLPIRMGNGASTIAAFTHSSSGGFALRVSVYSDLAYNGRISGGRIYIRKQNTNDDLTLLADIDIVKGVRMTLNGDHNSWSYESADGYYVLADATGNSVSPNIDTYETINGFSPDVKFLSIGGVGELYKSSVVANRRTFIANVKIFGSSGELEKHGDRIMYSEINKFDTFPDVNFIDVSKGDYGEYTALQNYADRLIAFKHNLVHIINIANPSPANWYLEDTVKYNGVFFPYNVTKTPYGVVWTNESGCFLYSGEGVVNLLGTKLGASEVTLTYVPTWSLFFAKSSNAKDVMIGYDSKTNSLVLIASPNGDQTCFNYDFDSQAWTYHTDIGIGSSRTVTNFATDWNNNLSLGKYDASSDVEFLKYLPVPVTKDNCLFVTKDIDFGAPGLIKKVYSVSVTYKSDGAETSPFTYAIDGKNDYSGHGGTLVGNFVDTSGVWDVVKLKPSLPVSCQSIAIRFKPASTGIFHINDINIEYRIVRNKVVT